MYDTHARTTQVRTQIFCYVTRGTSHRFSCTDL